MGVIKHISLILSHEFFNICEGRACLMISSSSRLDWGIFSFFKWHMVGGGIIGDAPPSQNHRVGYVTQSSQYPIHLAAVIGSGMGR